MTDGGIGTLIVKDEGEVVVDTLNVGTQGTITGDGTITVGSATLNNNGTIKPLGRLIVNGTFVQGPGGNLILTVDGTNPGQFDQLVIHGSATIEGNITLVISDDVDGTVPVIEAEEIDGTATVTIVDDSGNTVSETQVELTVGDGSSATTIEVDDGGAVTLGGIAIDIKPDDPNNRINSKSNAIIVVAMLAGIMPSDVTVAIFGPDGTTEAVFIGLGREDVDGDGDEDLIARFRGKDVDFTSNPTEACLTVMAGGQTFKGCDSVNVIK